MMGINQVKFLEENLKIWLAFLFSCEEKGVSECACFSEPVYFPLASSLWPPHPTPEWRSRQWGDQESGNFGLWNGEIQLKESGIPLTIVIQNPSSTDKESEIQVFTDKKAGIQYLEWGSRSVKSRSQDYQGRPIYRAWNHAPHCGERGRNLRGRKKIFLPAAEPVPRLSFAVSYFSTFKVRAPLFRYVSPRTHGITFSQFSVCGLTNQSLLASNNKNVYL